MDQFRNATLEIKDLHIDMAVTTMLQGTKSLPLQESLALRQPKSLINLFVHVNEYISQAEVMKVVTGCKEKVRKRKERDSDDLEEKKKDKTRKNDCPSKLQYKNYAQLFKPDLTS